MTIGMRGLHNLCANRILPIFCLKPEYSLYLTVVIVPFWETSFCVVQTEISPPHTPSLPIQPAGLFYDCCSEHVILASCRAKIKKRCGWCDGAPAVVLAPAWAPRPVLLKLGRLMAARSLHACQAPQMDLPASLQQLSSTSQMILLKRLGQTCTRLWSPTASMTECLFFCCR